MRRTSDKSLGIFNRMITQTIGVEVEMNNITRAKAAKIAAEFFGTRCEDTSARNGYSAWSAWDERGREWKFESDASITGPTSEQCELVTPILMYEDIPVLQELCRRLRHAGAKSDPTRMCGIHVHIGKEGHTPATLRNLVNLMASHEDLLIDALHIDRWRIDSYCRTVNPVFLREVNKKKPKTMAELADVWYESHGTTRGRTQHYNGSRYHMLNLHATFTKNTIEFRLFNFDAPDGERQNGIHAGQLKAYIQLCLALSQRAKDVKYISPKIPTARHENPKYVMRFWMKTLGMIGDDFKTARDLFVSRLEGNSDCRTGDRRIPAATRRTERAA